MSGERGKRYTALGGLAGLALVLGIGGCATSRDLPVQALRYRIALSLQPATHRISAEVSMDLMSMARSAAPAYYPATLRFRLHPALSVTQVSARGAAVRRHDSGPVVRSGDADVQEHVVTLDHPAESLTLVVKYEGTLVQDIAAGERPGEIHNTAMRAHVGEEGIFLGGGCWYPQPAPMEDAEPVLADFTLLVEPLPNMEFIAGAERDESFEKQTGWRTWRTPYPIEEIALVGGPYQVHEGGEGSVRVRLFLQPDQAGQAEGLLQTVQSNLNRYEPLVGPYPMKEYSVVSNFFSSGFAYPGFTLLSSAVIDMGERARTAHGYFDHEMLHSWWGNGVFVDPRDGNWCEALASYAANYYGHVLDGNDAEARRVRRNYSHFLSRRKPGEEKPLGTFGRPGGCDRATGYQKGAMVFHMLARRMGQDAFWSAIRRFNAEHLGRYASWEDLRAGLEKESGQTLGGFFEQWVRGGSAPRLRIEHAIYGEETKSLAVTISQAGTAFELDLPLRLSSFYVAQDVIVHANGASKELYIESDERANMVELDPDYHLFRRVAWDEIVPTTASTRSGDSLVVVMPSPTPPEPYSGIREAFESGLKAHDRAILAAGAVPTTVLGEHCALILGGAARDPIVAAFLSAMEFPVQWTQDGFLYGGVKYEDPGDAILCTARHPEVSGGGVTVVFANSDDAVPRGASLLMYDRSLVVFKNRVPALREDFERPVRVAVE